MAYAALTCLAGVIDQILPQEQKYISLCSKEQMKSLHEKVSLLQEFLEYISLRTFLPEGIDVLESRIRDTAYKIEDTIELVILTEPGKESESDVRIPTLDEFSSYFEDVQILLEEAMEMKKILDNNAIPESLHPLTTTISLRESSGSKGTKVVGLDKPLNEILDQVNRQGSMLRIVPITGMGGIGKTTLARASFEAPQTQHHFDVRFWVTVSQEYNIQDILRGLLPEAERSMKSDEQQLILHVYQSLKMRRYFIVLDDMWDEKVWDRVMNAFPGDNNGSCVILTTRLSGVASYVSSPSSVYAMKFLNEDQSWELLRENVYEHKHRSSEFEGIGRKIARNCKGLPLALVVVAGLLKFNKTIDYWEQVAENTNEKAIKSDNHLFEILCWSYTRLPPHLKACFLYMGLYEEDDEISTNELLRSWAAEGFLKPKHSRSMEEVAEECLEELVERSLVLVTKTWYSGKIRNCSVHDVIREVSIRKAEEEKFHYHFKSPVEDESVGGVLAVQRRVSVTNCFRHTIRLPRDTFFVTTHSLIDRSVYGSESMGILQCYKLLRVLNKVHISEHFHFRILCTLTNLRYLYFVYHESSDTPIMVPESISKLQNLETLIVSAEDTSIFFPPEIWKPQRLRHIVVMGRVQFPIPDQSVPSLQALSGVRNVIITRNLFEKISNLKILKLQYEDGEKEYTMESLQYLHQLEELSIRASNFVFQSGRLRPPNFVFPQNLRKLTLLFTRIPLENLSSIGLLANLKVLKLKFYSVSGEKWEPVEGQFLQLEHLKMEGIVIKHWGAESIHFPRLRKLVIRCHWLEEVPESIGEIETLETLIVQVYKEEAKRSVQKLKEIQQEMGNYLLQVIILDWFQSSKKMPTRF